jgi:hypothetical protein
MIGTAAAIAIAASTAIAIASTGATVAPRREA